ncbi:MAG: tryptophan--tRNA ligase [Thermoplasmata archaeon]|nr:tryptophan--tRNA ligase [Thermoplasmata archaeon]MCI4367462.1 tryptophan--tRNA ligase [Thermoplasmata archaeon]
MPAKDEFTVTPYEVKGRIDYARLRELFGTEDLTAALLDRLRAAADRPLPPSLERGVYYSHRDLGLILDAHAKGRPFFVYSGRGPSGPLHTSHLLAFELCKWFQDAFGAEMWIQITDDEKVWAKTDLPRSETYRWGLENLADLLALGFDPKKTHVFFDTRSIAAMYPLAVDVARKIPYSTVKAVFGFPPSTNVGLVFYTALQTVPCFYPSWVAGKDVPCLIPCGIDQDPHFRVTRDLAERLGYPKPALLHSQMMPGLLGQDRVMSTTGEQKDNALFLSDPPKEVERKLKKAFTGGRATVEEQRRLGATPEICSVWALWKTKFAPEKAEFDQITGDCRSGALLCGDCKGMLIERVNGEFARHRAAREAAKAWMESTIVEHPPHGMDVRKAGAETPNRPVDS